MCGLPKCLKKAKLAQQLANNQGAQYVVIDKTNNSKSKVFSNIQKAKKYANTDPIKLQLLAVKTEKSIKELEKKISAGVVKVSHDEATVAILEEKIEKTKSKGTV